jgi:hypothetical protein
LSTAGPQGAYGSYGYLDSYGGDETASTEAQKDKAKKDFSAAKAVCDATFDPEEKPGRNAVCVKVAQVAFDAAVKKIEKSLASGLAPKGTSTTTTTAPAQDPYKALLTPEEYARLNTTCKFSGKLTDLKAFKAYVQCRKQTADQLIAALSKQTASLTGQTLTTEEKDYTWYYVGGAAALAATGLAVWWFKFRK